MSASLGAVCWQVIAAALAFGVVEFRWEKPHDRVTSSGGASSSAGFITAPGETDVFMVVMAVFLVIAVLAIGLLFLRLHTLPERLAHKGHKLQFEIVAVLGLLALFTHQHIFWVAGLLLALIDIPDFGMAAAPDGRIAGEDRRHPAGRGRGRRARRTVRRSCPA